MMSRGSAFTSEIGFQKVKMTDLLFHERRISGFSLQVALNPKAYLGCESYMDKYPYCNMGFGSVNRHWMVIFSASSL